MKPTSDERHKVAAKLREFADTDVWLSAMFAELEKFGDTDRLRADVIADLIDPTCHIAYDDWASRQCMGPMLSCDRCGNAFPKINGPYQYCPCCGARVVSDDD